MAMDEAGWTLLIRRSFGIPDVIGEDAAARAVALALHAHNALPEVDQPINPTMETALVRAAAAVGESGAIDDALAGLDGGKRAAVVAINGQIMKDTHWSDPSLYAALESLGGALVDSVATFLSQHPFQNEAGDYFG
jgi:sulfur carrier protein ThiS